MVLSEYLLSIEKAERGRDRLDTAIHALATAERWKDIVSKFCLLHGISVVTAFALATETGDFVRFRNAGAFCSYLGLIPSLNESGESSSRGPITKTGNIHVRKLLIEAAWHHKRKSASWSLAPSVNIASQALLLAKKANIRLHDRAVHLSNRKLHPCKTNVAIASETACFVWALANLA